MKAALTVKGTGKIFILLMSALTWLGCLLFAHSFFADTVKIDLLQSRQMMFWSIVWTSPFLVFFIVISGCKGSKWMMLAGMLLIIGCIRPINSFVMQRADTAEWKERVEGMRYVQEPGKRNPSLQTDTLVKQKDTVLLKHYTENWQLEEGLGFTENYTDTAGIDADGGTWLIKSKQHVYSNKLLTPVLKWEYIVCNCLLIIFVLMVQVPLTALLLQVVTAKKSSASSNSLLLK